ncbi:MAG: hypothetical protein KF898_09330 [Parachlamydiales bacterium]|nr:hypothetical protein [Candidatus Acheromyda pituitae]
MKLYANDSFCSLPDSSWISDKLCFPVFSMSIFFKANKISRCLNSSIFWTISGVLATASETRDLSHPNTLKSRERNADWILVFWSI